VNLSESPALKSTSPAGGPYFDTPEAAKYLRISDRSLEKLRSKGGGPIYSKPEALDRVIYRQCDLDDWIAQHLRKNTCSTGEVR
jgi:hypothetical protein